jgi:tetratricopeptide (TPR) repeat protein
VPVQANAAYFMATNAASLREFEELRRIKEDRYMLTMLQVEKSHVPFPDEPPVAFPPAVTWREISNYRRDKYDAVGLEGPNTRNALRIRDKLNQTVNVDKEIENTPLKDVLSFLSDKYDVTFIVDVQAFDRDNANRTVEDTPVRLPKMPGVTLGTILRFVLAQVQGTYLVRRDYIEITTNNAAIAEKAVRAYPVADLVIPIPNSINTQALNQNLQVLGSSLSANGMAIFGALGGGQALGFAGPLGALGTLGALGALGGVSGAAAIGVIGGAGGVAGGGASGAAFSGALGFAGGNNQTNMGFGGGTLGFGGGQQGQFGNLGGQFGIQGGNTSGILIELIKDVIAPKEWNDRAARYLFNNINTVNPDDDQPILNPDLLNSMGYYQPSNALVVRGTSRLHTRIGGGNIGSAGGGVRMGAAPKDDKGDRLVIVPGQNRDKNNGGAAVAKAPATAPKPAAPKAEIAVAAAPKKDRDPKQAWEDAVEKGFFHPRQVIAVADLLAHFEKFEEVTELLKADLRHGVLAQPVCFDALAIALKQTGATIEEVERVRLSQIDLEPTNPQSYLKAAEAMNELGRPEQAVAFCKRAAGLEPNATDSYAQSLVYLDKAKAVDTDAVQWAAANLSSRDWAINDATNMADAKKALADLVAKLNAAGRRDDATRIAALASPSRHDLAIQTSWDNEADVDMAVTEPIGSVCSNLNRQTVGGGRWRGDRLMSKEKDRFSETYAATEAFSGTYEIKLTRIWGKPLGDKVTVKVTTYDGTPQKREEWHRVELGTDGTATLKVQVDAGRRTVAATVPPPAPRTPPVVARDPDRVFNLLRAMAEPAYAGMAKQHVAASGTSAAGTLNSQVMNSAVEMGPEVYHQQKLGSGTGADLVGQAVVSSDRRSVRVSAAPVFQTATAEPEVNLSLIPGGR